jgi:hypothetical protein
LSIANDYQLDLFGNSFIQQWTLIGNQMVYSTRFAIARAWDVLMKRLGYTR